MPLRGGTGKSGALRYNPEKSQRCRRSWSFESYLDFRCGARVRFSFIMYLYVSAPDIGIDSPDSARPLFVIRSNTYFSRT